VTAYASTVGRFTTELSPAETQALLAELPQGVYQLGEYVTGPLGLLSADTPRRIPPTRWINAFECDRPSCDRDHRVVLKSNSTTTSDVFSEIGAQWHTLPVGADLLLQALLEPGTDVTGRLAAENLPFLVAQCFADEELTTLGALAFEDYPERLRDALIEGGRSRKQTAQDATTIAASLTRAELVQLLTLVAAEDLASVIEKAISSQRIHISEVEPRAPRLQLAGNSLVGGDVQASQFGLRFGSPELASLRLYELIRALLTFPWVR
jgi:hypothetical protein